MSIEFFPDGGPDMPLVLIFGYDIPHTRELFYAIRSLKDEREQEVLVHALPGYLGVNGIELAFRLNEKNLGLSSPQDTRFSCELNPDGWHEVESRLGPFCDRCAAPGPFR